eukprot:6054272-Pyramimonas_sp.AAC.1
MADIQYTSIGAGGTPGKASVVSSMGPLRVRHPAQDRATELSKDAMPEVRISSSSLSSSSPLSQPVPEQHSRPLRVQELGVEGASGKHGVGNGTNARHFGAARVKAARRCISLSKQSFGSWNVEGLGKYMSKLPELEYYMGHCNIAVLCVQETGVTTHAETFFNDYMLILCGTTKPQDDGGFYSGVGFMVAPWAIQS